MLRTIFIASLSFITIQIYAQTLELVDQIDGKYGRLIDVKINSDGDRVYLFENAYDSIRINEQLINLPPKDSVVTSPYYLGRSYVLGVNENQEIFIKEPGGEVCALTDSSILVFSTMYRDTLFTTDTFYVNVANGAGKNLLLSEYNHDGNILRTKHWKSPFDCSYRVVSAQMKDGNLLVSGDYWGNEDGLLLDGHFLEIGTGNANGFWGAIDSDLSFTGLSGVFGSGREYNNILTKGSNDNILLVGSSTSTYVEFCEDSLRNKAAIPWGTDFLYFVQFDTFGNCINGKTVEYDYGSMYATSLSTLKDNSYLISGNYNSSFIGFDSLWLQNPSNEQTGFIVKFSDNLQAQRVLQLEGSEGQKLILGMVSDDQDHIWICGGANVDTLQVGGDILYSNIPGEHFIGYLAQLDKNFNVLSVTNLDQGFGQNLLIGLDGDIYLQVRYDVGHHDLFRVKDLTNSTDGQSHTINSFQFEVYPNPTKKASQINYNLKQSGNYFIEDINVYSSDGRLVSSQTVNTNHGVLEIGNNSNSILFIEFITNDKIRIIKKVVIN